VPRQEPVVLPISDQVLVVSFAFDSVDISVDFQTALDRKVETMLQSPSVSASITGFSDSRGDEVYNLELSRKRAMGVEQYLIVKGIQRHRLYVDWQGSLSGITDSEVAALGLENEERRIVLVRLSSDPQAIAQ
jgi:outer membrane protein OmpA-like peptidoglycan-associated protein